MPERRREDPTGARTCLVHQLERLRRSASRRIVGAAELRLDEALECEAEPERRVGCPDCSASLVPFARRARGPSRDCRERSSTSPEEDQEPRPSALVAELVARAASGRRERRAPESSESVQAQYSAEREQRLIQDRTVRRECPGAPRPARAVARSSRADRAASPRVSRGQERVSGERLIAELVQPAPTATVRVFDCLVESLETRQMTARGERPRGRLRASGDRRSASSTTWAKSSRRLVRCRRTRRMRASTTSALARCGPAEAGAIRSRSFASARRESPDSKCR